jgi:BMFP domain-containing protein YqiC
MTDSASFTPLHWLQGMVSELEGLRTVTVQNISRQVGVPTRDDFEVQRGLLEDARDRLARLEAQLAALAAKLDAAAP